MTVVTNVEENLINVVLKDQQQVDHDLQDNEHSWHDRKELEQVVDKNGRVHSAFDLVQLLDLVASVVHDACDGDH